MTASPTTIPMATILLISALMSQYLPSLLLHPYYAFNTHIIPVLITLSMFSCPRFVNHHNPLFRTLSLSNSRPQLSFLLLLVRQTGTLTHEAMSNQPQTKTVRIFGCTIPTYHTQNSRNKSPNLPIHTLFSLPLALPPYVVAPSPSMMTSKWTSTCPTFSATPLPLHPVVPTAHYLRTTT